jgi:hypothetical protein
VGGHVDKYLDWAVPSCAKLYPYRKDEHYLDVARVFLHDTKPTLALPGRTYDLLGPGWQQEHEHHRAGSSSSRPVMPWRWLTETHGSQALDCWSRRTPTRLVAGFDPWPRWRCPKMTPRWGRAGAW